MNVMNDFVRPWNTTSIKDLISIKKIISNEDKIKYNKEGYSIPYTLEEFKELYPKFNISNIYYQKNTCTPCCYFDIQKLIYKELPIYKTIADEKEEWIIFTPFENVAETLYKMISEIEELFYKKDFMTLFTISSEQINIEMFQAGYNCLDKESLYNIFLSIYLLRDFGFGGLKKNTVTNIYNNISEKDKKSIMEKISILPSDLIIYRGEGDNSNSFENAFSWTTNINIAYLFATRYSVKSARIVQGRIKRECILDYITNMGEDEIITTSDNVEITNIIPLIDFNSRLSQDDINDIILDLSQYKDIFNKYYKNCKLSDHDEKHSLRVAFLSMILARDYNLNQIQKNFLSLAALTHDISRTNEFEDEEHGLNSYNMLLSDFVIESTKFKLLLEYHCKNDEDFYEQINTYSEEERKELELLFKILKDADALDRVRFGIKALDTKYLRLEKSREYVLLANQLLNMYLRL